MKLKKAIFEGSENHDLLSHL